MGPGEKWGTAVAPEVGTAPGARSRRRSTFLLRQKSRAAFQGWRRGAGEVSTGGHTTAATKQLIYTRSALCFRAEAPRGAAAVRERSGWRHGWQGGWWLDWLLGASCLSARQHSNHHPTFLFIFPPMPAPPLTRTQAEHIRSACEACCARPCYADPPMVPWHHHTKLEKVLLMGTGRCGLGAGN